MDQNVCEDGLVTDRLVAHYEELAKEKLLHSAPLKSKMASLIFPVSSYTVNGGVMEFDYKWKYWEASRG